MASGADVDAGPESTSGLTYPRSDAASASEAKTSALATARAVSEMGAAASATWRQTWRNRVVSSSSMRSCALRMSASYSFISGVMNRSPPTSVWRRT